MKMNRRHCLGLPVLALAIGIAGCSRDVPLAPVSGMVKMNGKAIGNVRVDFNPDPDKGTTGRGSTGTTDDNGNFKLVYDDGREGAIIGNHRVVLTDLDTYGTKFVGRGDYRAEDKVGQKVEVPKASRFPKHYSDLPKSPLKQEVKAGMAPVVLEITK